VAYLPRWRSLQIVPYTPWRGSSALRPRAVAHVNVSSWPALPLPTLSPVTVTGATRPEGLPAGIWLDEGDISGQWAPPAGNPVGKSALPGSLIYGGVVLALVLTVAIVWGLGGFGRRTDLLRPVEPGALISTGPFEFSFTEAIAQPTRDTDGVVTKWEIVVIGQARTTGDESIAPNYFGDHGMFVIRDPASTMTAVPESAAIGDGNGVGGALRGNLVPGLPSTGYRLTFPLPVGYQPGPTIRFAVFDLVYKDPYLLGDDKEWRNGTYASRLELPVRVLLPKG
jgi:hypothetical protein